MKKILITGGAGFIGLKLTLRLLAEENCSITIVDNLLPQVHGPQAKVPLGLKNSRVRFFKDDITDLESLSKIIEGANPEIVFHLASETGTGQSYGEIIRYNQVNVLGTAILLQLLKAKAPNFKKIILASSRAIYGEGPWLNQDSERVIPKMRRLEDLTRGQFLPQDENEPLVRPLASQEKDPASPVSVYASTKLQQEYLVTQALVGTSAKAVILRFQNVYGPGQSLMNPYTGVLSIFSNQILNGQTLNIFEDGQIIRDFVYVDEVVEALHLSMGKSLPENIILNIGSEEAVTILSAAKSLMAYFGRPTDGYFLSGQFRVGDIRHALADASLAGRLLGWKTKLSFQEGLRRLVEGNSPGRKGSQHQAG